MIHPFSFPIGTACSGFLAAIFGRSGLKPLLQRERGDEC